MDLEIWRSFVSAAEGASVAGRATRGAGRPRRMGVPRTLGYGQDEGRYINTGGRSLDQEEGLELCRVENKTQGMALGQSLSSPRSTGSPVRSQRWSSPPKG